MGKREAAVETAKPAPNKGGKMKKVLAVIFYALALALYIAVTVALCFRRRDRLAVFHGGCFWDHAGRCFLDLRSYGVF